MTGSTSLEGCGPGASAVALRGSALRAEHLRVTGNSKRSRDADAPGSCLVIARSEATKQSSGAMHASFVDLRNETAALDCFASLAMTTQRKKEAERRQTCVIQPPRLTRRGAHADGVRSPIGVPLRLLPSGLSALGRNSRPGFLGRGRTFDPVSSLQPGSKDLAFLRGRYPRPPVPVQGTHLPDRS